MELKQLDMFYSLAKELNFTRTAEKLGYTQANITIQIKALEEELKVPLFNRMGRQISLTDEGEKLLLLASQVLELKDTISHISENRVDVGRIRIGVCDSLCVTRLPKLIGSYKQLFPNIDITLNILKCSEFYPLLAKNEIDLAFTIGYLKKEEDICYTAERLEPICVLASPSHHLCDKKNLRAKDFQGVPLILAEQAAYYRQNFEKDLIRENITPRIMVETESIQAIKKLTEQGLGVCILPRIAATDEIDSGRLAVLDYRCDYGIYSHIIWHNKKRLSPCQREFLSYAAEVLGQ
ncbi:MAG: LysR family transcriptional regulator [bacterium]|nr:LysR family transcriptional regulator [bacterium]